MPHIIVTGAAGFIGSHTVDCLLNSGHTVTGLDNFRTGQRANLAAALTRPDFTFHECDVARPGVLAALAAARPVDAIIHLAALVSVPESIAQPALNHSLNIEATFHVAEAARLHRVPRVVFASSAAVYGEPVRLPVSESDEKNPISPYGAAKLASEAILLGHAAAYGFVVRCHRYFNVFGPRQDPASPYSGVISIFQRQYRESRPVTVYGDGRQTRDFISVHDVARANALATTASHSGIANICTGQGTSLLELASHFARRHPAAGSPIHAPARAGDILHSIGNPSEAQRTLGFRATVTVENGLAELGAE